MKIKVFKNKLTGKIEYEAPNNQMDKFTGFIKLNKDPKIE